MKTKRYRIEKSHITKDRQEFFVIETKADLGWEEISKPMPLARAEAALNQLTAPPATTITISPDCVKIGSQINVYRIQNQWMSENTAIERFGATPEYLASLPEYQTHNEPTPIVEPDVVPQQSELPRPIAAS